MRVIIVIYGHCKTPPSDHAVDVRFLLTQVLAEIDQVLGDRAPNLDDLRSLPYCRATLGAMLLP
jgi:hypothetical protein